MHHLVVSIAIWGSAASRPRQNSGYRGVELAADEPAHLKSPESFDDRAAGRRGRMAAGTSDALDRLQAS